MNKLTQIIMMVGKDHENGRFTFDFYRNGVKCTRTIEEITENERKNYKFIGNADGVGLWHCIALGEKYEDGFLDRVNYFHYPKQESKRLAELRAKQPNSISVEFYE